MLPSGFCYRLVGGRGLCLFFFGLRHTTNGEETINFIPLSDYMNNVILIR